MSKAPRRRGGDDDADDRDDDADDDDIFFRSVLCVYGARRAHTHRRVRVARRAAA
jgi:hypothetical protein